MLIKKIFPILRESKNILLHDDNDKQWIGTSSAIYTAEGLPLLTDSTIMALMDIPSEKRGKYSVSETPDVLRDLCMDTMVGDIPVEQDGGFAVIDRGEKLRPMFYSDRVICVNEKYLKPFDDEESINYCVRKMAGYSLLIAKCGFIVKGIMFPTAISETTYEKIAKLARRLSYMPKVDYSAEFPTESEGSDETD